MDDLVVDQCTFFTCQYADGTTSVLASNETGDRT